MSNTAAVINQMAYWIGEAIRGRAVDIVPVLTGDLRKSLNTSPPVAGRVEVGSPLSYARAVHDGRPALTITPKNGKFLSWVAPDGHRVFVRKVHQPARKGKPFLRQAAEQVQAKGYDFLNGLLGKAVSADLAAELPKQIKLRYKA